MLQATNDLKKSESRDQEISAEIPVRQNPIAPANRARNGIPLTRFLRAASRPLQGTAAMTKTTWS